ncbi:MAG: glycosyltransferase family 4 protein [Micropepsaceae bacterium]
MAQPKLSVLQVIPALDAGGAERTAVDVAAAVVAAGGTAWIATKGGRLASEAEKRGAKILSGDFASKSPFQIWRNAGVIADLVRREGVTIIHARSRAPAWSAFIAARRTGAKFVATYHGIYNANGFLKRYYNSIMTRGDAIIANSQFTADHVLREHKPDSAKLFVIPRGTDIRAFTPENVPEDRIKAIRRDWSLKSGKPVIMLPNRLTRWKGQLEFVAALAKIADREFEAVMVGDAQERDGFVSELREAIDKAGLTQKIRMPGHCTDMPAAFMVADVVVAPSIEPEAFGRAAVEAQAMGKPIVASRLGAQTETVLDGKTGFLFEPGNADALAKAITAALQLPQAQRTLMAGAARERVLKNYTVDVMCERTLSVYVKLLSSGT